MPFRDKLKTWRDRDWTPSASRNDRIERSQTPPSNPLDTSSRPVQPNSSLLLTSQSQTPSKLALDEAASTASAVDKSLTHQRLQHATGQAGCHGLDEGLWEEALRTLGNDPKLGRLLDVYQAFIADAANNIPVLLGPDSTLSPGADAPLRPRIIQPEEWRSLLEKGASSAVSTIAKRRDDFSGLSKLLDLIINAKDALAFAASFEPHAAIAWTGVSALLPLLATPLNAAKDAISGLEFVAATTTRYKLLLETYYLRQVTSSRSSIEEDVASVSAQLKSHCVRMYCKMLEFQLRLACRYARNFMLRYVREVFLQDDWNGLLTEIKQLDSTARLDMGALDSSRLGKVVEQSHQILRNQIRQTLCCDFSSGKQVLPSVIQGTCTWLIRTDRYRKWTAGVQPFLFLTAGPGCGKSMLVKYLVDTELAASKLPHCYFFFGALGPAGDTPSKALSALIYQLYLNYSGTMTIFEHAESMRIVEDFYRNKGPNIVNEVKILWQVLSQIAEAMPEGIACIIDGLDQATGGSTEIFMLTVNQYYRAIQDSSKLRLLVTGRPYFDPTYSFKVLTKGLLECVCNLELDNVDQDTLLIVHSRAAELDLTNAVREHLVSALISIQQESRTFLWLRVIFHYIEQDPSFERATRAQIDNLVAKVPKELDNAYEEMLSKSSNRTHARLVLHILLAAREGLDLTTFRQFLIAASNSTRIRHRIINVDQSDDTLKRVLASLCGLLVTVFDNKVQLFHQTARDFLLDRGAVPRDHLEYPPQSFKQSFHPIESNLIISEICYETLNGPNLILRGSIDDNSGHYACRHWLQHHSSGLQALYHTLGGNGLMEDGCPRLEHGLNNLQKSAMEYHLLVLRQFNLLLSRPYFCDIASFAFWGWYKGSGVSQAQLEYGWEVWLLLLLSDVRCASIDDVVLRLMLHTHEEFPQPACQSQSGKRCPISARFLCSSVSEFKGLYRMHCSREYESWRDAEIEEKGLKKHAKWIASDEEPDFQLTGQKSMGYIPTSDPTQRLSSLISATRGTDHDGILPVTRRPLEFWRHQFSIPASASGFTTLRHQLAGIDLAVQPDSEAEATDTIDAWASVERPRISREHNAKTLRTVIDGLSLTLPFALNEATRINGYVRALLDVESPVHDELDFGEGDIITILSEVDGYWWRGELSGRVGIFPNNSVEFDHLHVDNGQGVEIWRKVEGKNQWFRDDTAGTAVASEKAGDDVQESQ